MCKQVPYWVKWVIAFGMTGMGVFVIVSSWYGLGNGGEADVGLVGDGDHAVIQQSSGLHILELNNSGDDGECAGDWSWSEYALVIIGFILVLKFTHILHYCLVSKVKIKSKVARQVAIQMSDLPVVPTAPPVDNDVVPGI